MLRLFVLALLALAPIKGEQRRAEMLIEHILQPQNNFSLEPLTEGLSQHAELFLVQTDNTRYVLRILSKPEHEISHEITCLQIASKAGYGPRLFAADASQGYILMEYLPPEPITIQDRHSSQFYQALADALSKMHQGPAFPKARPIFEDIQNDLSRLQKKDQYTDLAKRMISMISNIYTSLSKDAISAPCHNDLNPNNLIWSGTSFSIIDYEDCCQDDPYFDLATLSTFFCFSQEHETILLNRYYGRPMTDREKAHLYLSKQAFFIAYATRLFLICPDPQNWQAEPESYRDLFIQQGLGKISIKEQSVRFRFARALLNEAEKNYRSQQFTQAVQLLGN